MGGDVVEDHNGPPLPNCLGFRTLASPETSGFMSFHQNILSSVFFLCQENFSVLGRLEQEVMYGTVPAQGIWEKAGDRRSR